MLITSLKLSLIILVLVGCTTRDSDKMLTTDCTATCDDCKKVTLRCGQELEVDRDTVKHGVIGGASIGN